MTGQEILALLAESSFNSTRDLKAGRIQGLKIAPLLKDVISLFQGPMSSDLLNMVASSQVRFLLNPTATDDGRPEQIGANLFYDIRMDTLSGMGFAYAFEQINGISMFLKKSTASLMF